MIRIRQDVTDAITRMAEVQGDWGPFSVEVCGLLVTGVKSDAGIIDGFWSLRNVHDQPWYRYAVDVDDQLFAWKALGETGYRVAGWYHSHIENGPELSAEDIAMAANPALVHLVFSVPLREFRAWRVGRAGDDTSVVSVALEVV